jgi:hypothetical protein
MTQARNATQLKGSATCSGIEVFFIERAYHKSDSFCGIRTVEERMKPISSKVVVVNGVQCEVHVYPTVNRVSALADKLEEMLAIPRKRWAWVKSYEARPRSGATAKRVA